MVEEHHDAPSKPLRRQRLRVSTACQACRSRKVKCDGGRPACARCQVRGKTCTYSRDSVTVGQQIERKARGRQAPSVRNRVPVLALPPASRAHSLEKPSTSTAVTPSTIGPSPRSDRLNQDQEPDPHLDQNRAYYTAHGRFAGQVAAVQLFLYRYR